MAAAAKNQIAPGRLVTFSRIAFSSIGGLVIPAACFATYISASSLQVFNYVLLLAACNQPLLRIFGFRTACAGEGHYDLPPISCNCASLLCPRGEVSRNWNRTPANFTNARSTLSTSQHPGLT
jgi:hypothetical protein